MQPKLMSNENKLTNTTEHVVFIASPEEKTTTVGKTYLSRLNKTNSAGA